MRLAIEESAFLSGRDGMPGQFLIWVKDIPKEKLEQMTPDEANVAKCELNAKGAVIYAGDIFAKRRRQSGRQDALVLMVEDHDVGKLQAGATIELDLATPA